LELNPVAANPDMAPPPSSSPACVVPLHPVVKVPAVLVVAEAGRTQGLKGLNAWSAAGQAGATEYYAGACTAAPGILHMELPKGTVPWDTGPNVT
jgi:hypothetical protein